MSSLAAVSARCDCSSIFWAGLSISAVKYPPIASMIRRSAASDALLIDTAYPQSSRVLYPYDAGTDSGTNYTSPNNPTDPAEPIFAIEGYPFYYNNEVVPLGTFTFKKV